MEDKKIKVRILPGHGIGGVGGAGDEVWMSEADAEMYVRDGYVEVVDADASSPSTASGLPLSASQKSTGTLQDVVPQIMKPQSKRIRKK